MFERFTKDARAAVVRAQVVAREMDAERIGSAHVLLGCATGAADGPAAAALAELGVRPDRLAAAVRDHPTTSGLDAEALASLGIDLAVVQERADAVFGPGALSGRRRGGRQARFTPGARKALELALREAIHARHRQIDTGHIVLGMLRMPESSAFDVLRRCDVDPDRLRSAIRERQDAAAA